MRVVFLNLYIKIKVRKGSRFFIIDNVINFFFKILEFVGGLVIFKVEREEYLIIIG